MSNIQEVSIQDRFKNFVEMQFGPMDDAAGDLPEKFVEAWKQSGKNLSQYVREMYGSTDPTADTPQIKRAIQAAHYLKRKAGQEEKNETGTPKPVSPKTAKPQGPTLEEALRVVLAAVEDQEKATAALKKFNWQVAVRDVALAVLDSNAAQKAA